MSSIVAFTRKHLIGSFESGHKLCHYFRTEPWQSARSYILYNNHILRLHRRITPSRIRRRQAHVKRPRRFVDVRRGLLGGIRVIAKVPEPAGRGVGCGVGEGYVERGGAGEGGDDLHNNQLYQSGITVFPHATIDPSFFRARL